MQEFLIDTKEWKAFWKRWGDVIDRIPGMKESMLERIEQQTQQAVWTAIDSSGLSDSRGRVKHWQNPHTGSGKGYVAVRPDSVEVAVGYRRKSDGLQTETLNAGALTNFLSSGHWVRGRSGRTKRYRRRARMTRVRGFDFYEKAKAEAEKIAIQEAKAMLREIGATIGL